MANGRRYPLYGQPCDVCGASACYFLEDEHDGGSSRCARCGPARALPLPIDEQLSCRRCGGLMLDHAWNLPHAPGGERVLVLRRLTGAVAMPSFPVAPRPRG